MNNKFFGLLLTGFILMFFSSVAQKTGYPVKKINGLDYYVYTVEPSEGLLAIGRKFEVSADEISKVNPLVNGLKAGQQILIPTGKSHLPKTTSDFIQHTVEKKQTMFAISHKYNVSQEDIEKLNPELKNGLREGMVLNIPESIKIKKQKEAERLHFLKTENTKTAIVQNAEKQKIRLAFLLPFMLDQVKKEPILERFQNFYSGALIAIQSAKEKGISFEIYTYDTDKTEEKITEVLNYPELKTMDLIIGPAFSNQVSTMANFAKSQKVNTLIPFTSKVPDIENNPYLFQFNPGSDAELKSLFELFNGKYKTIHIVFAEIQGVSPMDDGKIREEAMKIELKRQHKSVSVTELSSTENINFNAVLKKGEKNLIIFNSDKYSIISPYIKPLLSATLDNEIVLLEQFSWRNQLEVKPDCIFVSPFITDLNELAINKFNNQFDQYFGKDVTVDSPRYDLLGYDLTNYFITYINHFGNSFSSNIGSIHNIFGIQSQPDFERISKESGFINQRVYLSETDAQK
jgi:LysM repeat protein